MACTIYINRFMLQLYCGLDFYDIEKVYLRGRNLKFENPFAESKNEVLL